MRSIFERGVPLKEHVGSCAVDAARARKKTRARAVSMSRDDGCVVGLRMNVVKTSRDEFVHCKQTPLTSGVATGPPV